MMVIFTDFLKGPHNDDFFSRCTSSLIVVCREETANKIVPPNEECEFAYKIPVQGKQKIIIYVMIIIIFHHIITIE